MGEGGICDMTPDPTVPLTGTPPSNDGGSHVIVAESSPTDVHLVFPGGLGTSGEPGYSWKMESEERRERGVRGDPADGIQRLSSVLH